jgi:(S)-2-hydroxyglutarate dehydrogenase
MVDFCRAHAIPHEVCGKLIVATGPEEKPLLEGLYAAGGVQRARIANGCRRGSARDRTPRPLCREVRVTSTGIVNYRVVCEKLAELVALHGASCTWAPACFARWSGTA